MLARFALPADVKVFDTCGDADTAMRDVFYAVKDALEQQDVPLLGEQSAAVAGAGPG